MQDSTQAGAAPPDDTTTPKEGGIPIRLRLRALPMTASSVVELPGIEPGSYGIPSRLLRAQFAVPLLGSPGHANKPRRRSQSLFSVPAGPATEPVGLSL